MRALVVYYSRTGNTRKVARFIASKLAAEFEEIVDTKKRQGVLGWIGAGRDAMLHRETPIGPVQKDPASYDLVVIGSPIWAGNVAAPVRTYLVQYGRRARRVAFFLTMKGQGEAKVLDDMAQIVGKTPFDKLVVRSCEVADGSFAKGAAGFAAKLTGAFGVA